MSHLLCLLDHNFLLADLHLIMLFVFLLFDFHLLPARFQLVVSAEFLLSNDTFSSFEHENCIFDTKNRPICIFLQNGLFSFQISLNFRINFSFSFQISLPQ